MPKSTSARPRKTPRSAADPVTAAVVRHRLFSITAEMGEAMLRTSYSQILNSSRDFSVAVCDAEGRLIAQAEHIPIHVGAMPWALKAVRERFAAAAREGDVYLSNDPYYGGSHLPDLTVFVPVFHQGKLRFWSMNRSHQSDIGGATHGAYNADATEIYQEGIRLPPMLAGTGGEIREDIAVMLAANVRHAADFRGDLASMLGAAKLGEKRLKDMLDEFGLAALSASIEALLDASEREARAVTGQWRDGVFHGDATLDDDGHGRENIKIRARVEKRGSDVTVDYSESDPQCLGFVNSSHANMQSAAAVALSYLIDPGTPKNHGSFRPLKVIAREGTVVWAREGAPVTLCTSHCGNEMIEAVVVALSKSCPERAMGGWGRRFRIAIRGMDPRTKKEFIWHLFHARPGGGGSIAGKGYDGGGEWHSGGGLKFGSVEVTETRFPLLLWEHDFAPGTGGAGKHRGGDGVKLRLQLATDAPASGNTAGDGVRHGARGINGGGDGAPHRYLLKRGGKTIRAIKTKETGVELKPGDVLDVRSGGGGGWGKPG